LDSAELARDLKKRGDACLEESDLAQAEIAFREALEHARGAYGNRHPYVAIALGDLGMLRLAIADYDGAIELLRQARKIEELCLPADHPQRVAGLINLGTAFLASWRYREAEDLFQEVLRIVRQFPERYASEAARTLNALALRHGTSGQDDQAEQYLRESLEFRRCQGENTLFYAVGLHNLAVRLLARGDHSQAEVLLSQTLTIVRSRAGEGHPLAAATLRSLAEVAAARERWEEAYRLLDQAHRIHDRLIGTVFGFGSDRQRLEYADSLAYALDRSLTLMLRHLVGSDAIVRRALDLVLRRKVLAGEALAVQRDLVLGERYPHLRPHLEEMNWLRLELVRKTLAGPGSEGPEVYQRQLAEWSERKEQREAELARRIPEMGLRRLADADHQSVARALPEGSVLVQFVHFRLIKHYPSTEPDMPGEPPLQSGITICLESLMTAQLIRELSSAAARYVAFVLPAGTTEGVRLIDLGEAGRIDHLIAVYHAAVEEDDHLRGRKELIAFHDAAVEKGNPRNLTTQTDALDPWGCRPARPSAMAAGTALRSAVFDPLTAALGRCRRLLIAPDGNLTRVPFGALPSDGGRYLLDDYRISYLATGRDVLRCTPRPCQPADVPVVIADPDFNLKDETPAPTPPAAKPRRGVRRRRRVTEGGASRGQTPGAAPEAWPGSGRALGSGVERGAIERQIAAGATGWRESVGFSRLPGTRLEGERVAARLGVAPWFGETAVVSRLRAIRSPHLLHLATHGFFLSDLPGGASAVLWGKALVEGDGMPALGRRTFENPLLRSGLALAGINTWLHRNRLPADAEEGLLTAEDVCALDLRNTELVVLSACQTGLGRVHTTEGVLGLRRAFLLAGAKSLVVSLWKVSDLATAILMDRFYEDLLLRGLDRDEALHEAQRYTRDATLGQIRQEWLTPLCIERLAGNSKSGRAYLEQLNRQPDDHRPFEHPFYWGAFICQGDTAQLPAANNGGPQCPG
jgi:CHAT domain-containing protein/tetratricopeptide (TPR) repeat protein